MSTGGGGCLPGGGGVCLRGSAQGGVCPERGCLPGGCLLRGVCLPGGCLPKGVFAYVGVCLWGMCLPGGGCTPPPVNRITGRCKNITFPQLLLRTVKRPSKLRSGLSPCIIPLLGRLPNPIAL